jgi:hypothetical protein
LTVLGGLLPSDPVGVHLLELPPYSPPPATSGAGKPGSISLPKREALRSSISPVAHHLYPTSSPPEDFLLLPRSSPHYGLAYDPSSILITSGRDPRYAVLAAPHASNNIDAFTFPPTTIRPPHPLSLPSALSFAGKETCSAATLVNVGGVAFRQLLHQFDISDESGERLPLKGGTAFPQPRPNRVRGPVPSSSDQHPRLLLTTHTDLVVRFWDVSNQVLWGKKENEVSEAKITQEFPRPLGHLDADVKAALKDPRAGDLAAARLFRERPWELELDQVKYAEENGEVTVTLSTGDIIVFRFVFSSPSFPSPVLKLPTTAYRTANAPPTSSTTASTPKPTSKRPFMTLCKTSNSTVRLPCLLLLLPSPLPAAPLAPTLSASPPAALAVDPPLLLPPSTPKTTRKITTSTFEERSSPVPTSMASAPSPPSSSPSMVAPRRARLVSR